MDDSTKARVVKLLRREKHYTLAAANAIERANREGANAAALQARAGEFEDAVLITRTEINALDPNGEVKAEVAPEE